MKFKVTNKFKAFLMLNIKQECLDEVLQKIYEFHEINAGSLTIHAEQTRNDVEFVLFPDDDKYFIQIPEYDPNKWNSYYDLIPPNADYYRVTYRTRQNTIRKECWYWDGMKWCYGAEYPRPVAETCFFDIKFKPWDN